MAVEFDHIAFAAEDQQPTLDLLSRKLGATPLFGQVADGFRWVLVRVGTGGNGLTVELLEPWNELAVPFLRRFLDRHGEGPHHLTFKTSDLAELIERLQSAGIEPVDVSLGDPAWREAFLRPRDAHGTIVQLAESNLSRPPMDVLVRRAQLDGPASLLRYARGHGVSEVWWSEPQRSTSAVALERVVLATVALQDACILFRDVLEGRVIGKGQGWVELEWPGPGRLRIEEAGDGDAGIIRIEASSLPSDRTYEILGTPVVVRLQSK